MRLNDILLVIVALAGIGAGVGIPFAGRWFHPFLLYFMMTILFFSFFRMDFSSLLHITRQDFWEISFWTMSKLIVLPMTAWALTVLVAPDFALAVLLLSGVSAGVTGPFFAQVLGADVARVLKVVIVSSLLVPFTLPAMVSLLMGAQINIPFSHMFVLLLKVIFIPLFLALAVKKTYPDFIRILDRVQFPVSLALFFIINLTAFSAYADFILSRLNEVLQILAVSILLSLGYNGFGLFMGWAARGRLDGLAGAVTHNFINNVLIVVFAAEFFGPECPLLAALYMVPLFLMVIPLRWVSSRKAEAQ